jgi:hypothetical protein
MKALLSVIGHCNGLFFRLESGHCQNWAKNFICPDLHVRFHVCKHSGCQKISFLQMLQPIQSHQCGLMNAPQPITLVCTFET